MRILDLFCGAGGFSMGFIQASPRFSINLAVDIDYRTLQTYHSNLPKTRLIDKDIQNLHSNEILAELDHQYPDIIIASPPCESFSSANPNRRKSTYDQLYADEKGRLLLHTIRIIMDLEPKFFIIENVPQLASAEMRELILHEFSRSSYEQIFFNILEATKFGVPSSRKRVFISNISLKVPVNESLFSVNEAFHSLPSPTFEILNHELTPTSPKVAKKIAKVRPGEAMVYFRGSHYGIFRNYIRLLGDQPSPTVMGKSRFIHPYEPRLCTVREHARLMSYPDTYEFFGPQIWQYNQVGESVPPLLATNIALQILMGFPER
ncbi:MAG: DNA cytosine methyltransferase [Candidatus Hodarchaeales archaeon]|jgi:DNA (cytosine-5)-methyltransferase 1